MKLIAPITAGGPKFSSYNTDDQSHYEGRILATSDPGDQRFTRYKLEEQATSGEPATLTIVSTNTLNDRLHVGEPQIPRRCVETLEHCVYAKREP